MADTPSKSRDEKMMKQQDQIAEKRAQQEPGLDSLPRVDANRKVTISPPTKLVIDTVREDESERFVHVFTRVKHMNPAQNDFINEDRVIVMHANEFDRKVDEGFFNLFTQVEVIHDPRKNAPSNYQLKKSVVKLDEKPVVKNTGAEKALAERSKELDVKEKELLKKQQDLEAREAALNTSPGPEVNPDPAPKEEKKK